MALGYPESGGRGGWMRWLRENGYISPWKMNRGSGRFSKKCARKKERLRAKADPECAPYERMNCGWS